MRRADIRAVFYRGTFNGAVRRGAVVLFFVQRVIFRVLAVYMRAYSHNVRRYRASGDPGRYQYPGYICRAGADDGIPA